MTKCWKMHFDAKLLQKIEIPKFLLKIIRSIDIKSNETEEKLNKSIMLIMTKYISKITSFLLPLFLFLQ